MGSEHQNLGHEFLDSGVSIVKDMNPIDFVKIVYVSSYFFVLGYLFGLIDEDEF